jgi:hypothetical protein
LHAIRPSTELFSEAGEGGILKDELPTSAIDGGGTIFAAAADELAVLKDEFIAMNHCKSPPILTILGV